MTKRILSQETRAKLSLAGKKRAQAFTSDYQKETRAQLPIEVCQANGRAAYQRMVERHGKAYAQDKAAEWRIEHPSSLETKVIEWLNFVGYEREVKIEFPDGFYCYVDFLFPGNLVIEVNGKWVHEQRPDRDTAKYQHLADAGYTLVIIPEADVRSGKGKDIIDALFFGDRSRY